MTMGPVLLAPVTAPLLVKPGLRMASPVIVGGVVSVNRAVILTLSTPTINLPRLLTAAKRSRRNVGVLGLAKELRSKVWFSSVWVDWVGSKPACPTAVT